MREQRNDDRLVVVAVFFFVVVSSRTVVEQFDEEHDRRINVPRKDSISRERQYRLSDVGSLYVDSNYGRDSKTPKVNVLILIVLIKRRMLYSDLQA